MKVELNEDEWYPVFGYNTNLSHWYDKNHTVDIDEETLKRWDDVMEEFYNLQRELSELFYRNKS